MDEMTYTYDLAATASAYHDAETRTERLAREMATAVSDLVTARPDYFGALAERLAADVGVRALQREVKDATGRSATSVERDIARVVVMTATGWDDAETVRETPNVGQANGPGAGALKSAVSEKGKREARAAVRALYAAPAAEAAPDPATGSDESDGDDGGADHGTKPGPDPVDIHDQMLRAMVDYVGAHQSIDDGLKNLARMVQQCAAVVRAADTVDA